MKYLLKAIAIVLMLTLLAGVMPLETIAAYVNESATSSAQIENGKSSEQTQKDESEKASADSSDVDREEKIVSPITGEDQSRRDEFTKYFRCEDGSYEAAMYSTPVHYEENGEWKDIDNTLSLSEKKRSSSGKSMYVPTDSGLSLEIPQSFSDGQEIRLSNKGYTIELGVSNKNKNVKLSSEAKISDSKSEEALSKDEINDTPETEKSKNEIIKENNFEKTKLAKVNTALKYEGIFPSSDLEYIVTPIGIKENIIINSKQELYEYNFTMNLGGLIPVERDDGSVYLLEGKESPEPIFILQAPYMFDSAHESSEKVKMIFIKNGNDYLLNLIADEGWINAPERSFPVTIDPTIITESKKSSIDSTFITSATAYQNTNHSTKLELLVGKESTYYGDCRSLFKFELPTLRKGDIVVDAEMHIAAYDHSFYSSTTPDLQINAHMISGSWENDKVKWSNKPSYNSTVMDYSYIKRSDIIGQANWKDFNITSAVKQWYDGTVDNYGIMVKSYDEKTIVKGAIWPERYNSVTDAYPVISISIRNNKGLEDYWTYSEMSAGAAGTAYVNDYSGNLVFEHLDAATSGMKFPVSLSHYYNSAMAGYHFNFVGPYVGRGWKLNLMQTITVIRDFNIIGNEFLCWKDADGTEHSFYFDDTDDSDQLKFYDEDGLGLELIEKDNDNDHMFIKDKKGTEMRFLFMPEDPEDEHNIFGYGVLDKITDANGRSMTITYTSDYSTITKITDGSNNYLTLEYVLSSAGNKYLRTIKDSSGRETNYYYNSNGELVTIVYPDNTYSDFEYIEGRMIFALDYNRLAVVPVYDNNGRVSTIIEAGHNSVTDDFTIGQELLFDYSKYNTTIITSNGSDCIANTADDLETTLQFDNWGRTISTKEKAAGTVLGASVASYTSGSSQVASPKKNNRVTNSGTLGRNIVNLITNNSAEDGITGWTSALWSTGTCDFTFSSVTTQKYHASKSFMLKSTSFTIDARARAYQNYRSLTPGGTYTFSAYVKTVDVNSTNYGACIALYVEASSGGYTTYSEYLNGTTRTSIDNGWRRLSVTVTLPLDVTCLRANMAIRAGTGDAYFDGLQLDNSSVVNTLNLIENGSLETGSGLSPTKWSQSNLNIDEGDGLSTEAKAQGLQSFKIVGKVNKSKEIIYELPVSGSENDSYIISGWAKANALNRSDSRFEIYVKITYTDNTSASRTVAKFNPNVSDWQYTAGILLLDNGNNTNVTPAKITIYIRYHRQANTAYFDYFQVVKDSTQAYTYDNSGNLVSASSNADNKSSMEYSNSNLTKSTNAKGYDYKYTYDNKHNVTQAESQNGVRYKYNYNYIETEGYNNANGLPISFRVLPKSETADFEIFSSTGYTDAGSGISAGAYTEWTRDDDGKITRYAYDLKKGTLSSVTDPNNNVTSYTYDTNTDRLTKVQQGTTVNNYGYTSNRLSTITHNGFNYSFTYDSFGNVKSTKVGSRILSTNTYLPYNGTLNKVTYENGYQLEFNSNNYGLPSTVYSGTNLLYSWKYSNNRDLYEHKDHVNGLVTSYKYDSIGRPVLSRASTISTSDLKYETGLSYDTLNNVSSTVNIAGGRTIIQAYSYGKDNLPDTYTMTSDRKHIYGYDSLNRMNKLSLTTNTPVDINYAYKVSDRDDSGADKYRTYMVRREIIENTAYRYSYDNLRNITQIEEGTRISGTNEASGYSTKVTYTYDSLGQLTRENNVYSNKTTVYTYDTGGNITSKKEYAYTTGTVGTAISTKAYVYGDTGWKDLLTSYNGTAITYDMIGNPLSYRGYTMAWNGRQLKTLSGNGVTGGSYKYDASGLRSQKTVSGVTSTYQYVGDKLYYERRGSTDFYYLYDSLGNLSRITYYLDGVNYTYYTVTNTRGDVEAIYNGSGSLVARYTYDAWGNTISIKNASGTVITDTNHVAHRNPFRYRGYYYDAETGLYYVTTRYYDPTTGRFINADGQINQQEGFTGFNLFQYCGNNPVNRMDPTGEAWWHWVAAVAVVAVCAVAVVATAGGAAAAIAAVAAVGNGMAAATVASTVAAGAFIGSSMALGGAALYAASNSKSAKEFADYGEGALYSTAGGAVLGAADGYATSRSSSKSSGKSVPNPNGKKGGAAHQAEIAKQTAKFSPSQVKFEVKINTPGGMKPYRYADFSVTQNGQTWYGNVGRQLQSGLPCARERYAISDIQGAGGTIRFFPYN